MDVQKKASDSYTRWILKSKPSNSQDLYNATQEYGSIHIFFDWEVVNHSLAEIEVFTVSGI